MNINELKSSIQRHLSDGLVTIVGSGLSCAEGMPSMAELGNHLKSSVSSGLSSHDETIWRVITNDIDDIGLEAALLRHNPTDTLEYRIMTATAQYMTPKEQQIIMNVISGEKTLKFSFLLKHILNPSDGAIVITTNYDRLIEHSAESIGLGVDTMFIGSYIGEFNEQESYLNFLRKVTKVNKDKFRYHFRDRIILCKPHGSFDWYLRGDRPVRHTGDVPLRRLIITPGLNKFRNGYNIPFDRHRERANSAIDKAKRYLIIGYGFNDDHLETHLKPNIRTGKPTIIITHILTENARALALSHDNILGIEHSEEDGNIGTGVISGGNKHFFPGLKLWDVENLVKEVLEP